MIERKITIFVSGETEADVEEAFEEATTRLSAGCIVSKDENENGGFCFTNENVEQPNVKMNSYICRQLERVQPAENELAAIQLASGPVKTNWMNLTPAQFNRVRDLLIELKGDE